MRIPKLNRRRKVAPGPCRCTSGRKSYRKSAVPNVFRPPPLVPAPTKPSRRAYSLESDTTPHARVYSVESYASSRTTTSGTFCPQYASTGISAADLETSKQHSCATLVTTLHKPPTIRIPDIQYTMLDTSTPIKPTTPQPTTPLHTTFIVPSTPSPTKLTTPDKSHLSRLGKLRQNLKRGRTFLRKMARPRSLPPHPSITNETTKCRRSLPILPYHEYPKLCVKQLNHTLDILV